MGTSGTSAKRPQVTQEVNLCAATPYPTKNYPSSPIASTGQLSKACITNSRSSCISGWRQTL